MYRFGGQASLGAADKPGITVRKCRSRTVRLTAVWDMLSPCQPIFIPVAYKDVMAANPGLVTAFPSNNDWNVKLQLVDNSCQPWPSPDQSMPYARQTCSGTGARCEYIQTKARPKKSGAGSLIRTRVPSRPLRSRCPPAPNTWRSGLHRIDCDNPGRVDAVGGKSGQTTRGDYWG